MVSECQDKPPVFGSIAEVAGVFFSRKSDQKLQFLFNAAVRFIEINCQDHDKGFTEVEYQEWVSIAKALNNKTLSDPIKFNLDAAHRFEDEDRVLIPVILIRNYQIKQCPAAKRAEYLDSMVKQDAKDILLGNKDYVKDLLIRTVKIYSHLFDEADAEKYTTMFIYAIIDPASAFDPDADPQYQPMLKTAQGHQDIGIGKIASVLYSEKNEQRELILNVAKYIMSHTYSTRVDAGGGAWEKDKGYDVQGFAQNSIAMECAAILEQSAREFAHKIYSMLDPAAAAAAAMPEHSYLGIDVIVASLPHEIALAGGCMKKKSNKIALNPSATL